MKVMGMTKINTFSSWKILKSTPGKNAKMQDLMIPKKI